MISINKLLRNANKKRSLFCLHILFLASTNTRKCFALENSPSNSFFFHCVSLHGRFPCISEMIKNSENKEMHMFSDQATYTTNRTVEIVGSRRTMHLQNIVSTYLADM